MLLTGSCEGPSFELLTTGISALEEETCCSGLLLESVKTHLLLAEEGKITPLLVDQLPVGTYFHQ